MVWLCVARSDLMCPGVVMCGQKWPHVSWCGKVWPEVTSCVLVWLCVARSSLMCSGVAKKWPRVSYVTRCSCIWKWRMRRCRAAGLEDRRCQVRSQIAVVPLWTSFYKLLLSHNGQVSTKFGLEKGNLKPYASIAKAVHKYVHSEKITLFHYCTRINYPFCLIHLNNILFIWL